MIDDRIDHRLDLVADEGFFLVITDDMEHPIIGQQEDRASRQTGQEAVHHRDTATRRRWLSLVEPGFQLLEGQKFRTLGSFHAATAIFISACSCFQCQGRQHSKEVDFISPDTMRSSTSLSHV